MILRSKVPGPRAYRAEHAEAYRSIRLVLPRYQPIARRVRAQRKERTR